MSIIPFLNRVNAAIINPLILVGFAVAFVYFAYAVFTFISSEGKERDDAKSKIIWSAVGIFIMLSVYGLLNFVLATFDIPKNEATNYLQL